jgi:hypothetical protein
MNTSTEIDARIEMHDAIEAELLAARTLPFASDEAAWTDRYVTATSRLAPDADPRQVAQAARAAWAAHGWAHPAVVAHLEHELGPLELC